MKKSRIIALAAVVAIVAVIAVSAVRSNRREQLRREAHSLYTSGQYREAAELYAQMDDSGARSMLKQCEDQIAIADARTLAEAGKAEEALELLMQHDPRGQDVYRIANSRAAELVEQGLPDQACQLLEEYYPTSDYMYTCKQIVSEQAFQAHMANGEYDEAGACLKTIREKNQVTRRLTAEELDGLQAAFDTAVARQAAQENLESGKIVAALQGFEAIDDADGVRRVAEAALAEGDYTRAWEAYEYLEDRDGLLAVVDAKAAAGQTGDAFDKAVIVGDTGRAGELLDRLIQEDALLASDKDGGGLVCRKALKQLAERDDEASAALAARIVDQTIELSRAMIAEGRFSEAYYALMSLSSNAEAFRTEEVAALMGECLFDLPERNGVVADTGLVRQSGAADTATITVYNNNKESLVLVLRAYTSDDRIMVYVRGHSQYTFTVAAGYYYAVAKMGTKWFGDKDNFGIRSEILSVSIKNAKAPTAGLIYGSYDGNRLEGDYTMTVD